MLQRVGYFSFNHRFFHHFTSLIRLLIGKLGLLAIVRLLELRG